jgi:hypothetical protein
VEINGSLCLDPSVQPSRQQHSSSSFSFLLLAKQDGRLSFARRKEKFETDNGVVAAQTSRANAFFFQPRSMGSQNGQKFSVSTENNLKMGIFSVTQSQKHVTLVAQDLCVTGSYLLNQITGIYIF